MKTKAAENLLNEIDRQKASLKNSAQRYAVQFAETEEPQARQVFKDYKLELGKLEAIQRLLIPALHAVEKEAGELAVAALNGEKQA